MDTRKPLLPVADLIRSYTRQTELYRKLYECVQTVYSRLVLSRGNLQNVMGILEDKQRLMQHISEERARIQESSDVWLREKDAAAKTPETERLNEILAGTENAIRDFLGIEQQLELYLQRLVEKENGKSHD